jgi:alpha-amylase
LLRNFVLSDDIAFRFSNRSWNEWPLTADKYATWLNKLAPKSELVNIFIDYETFGEHHWRETGIFDFLSHLPGAILKKTPYKFMTPSEVADTILPVAAISVPSPISWADEERDITAWLGNELQTAAVDKLYDLTQKVNNCNFDQIKKDWVYLQSSDHFYYMCTKFFSDGAVHAYFNPYETPYDAFMNYMNVLSDFEIRINRMCSATEEQIEILKRDSEIKAKNEIIANQANELEALKEKLLRSAPKIKAESKRKTRSKTSGAENKEPTLTEIAAEALAKARVKTEGKTSGAKRVRIGSASTRTPKSKSGIKRSKAAE